MIKRSHKLLLTAFLLFASGLIQAAIPSIKANGAEGSVTIASSDSVTISIHMSDAVTDPVVDWWIAVVTPLPAPDDVYFFNGSSWTTDMLVAYQQPIANFDSLEVLTVSGLPAGTYTFYFALDLDLDGQLDMDSLIVSSVELSVQATIPQSPGSCGNSSEFFSVAPLESDAYVQIDPLGATNPSGHTFPTVHTYMMLADKTVARDVFAPGQLSLDQVARVENLSSGGTDFSIFFTPCPEITGYFDHMSSLNSAIDSQLGPYENCNQYFSGANEYRYCFQFVSIDIEAGYKLGTVGGPIGQGSAALDFGLRDSRITPLHYANPSRLGNSDQTYVVCPYDYFEPGADKTTLFEKLANARTDSPVCGAVAHDVDNTLQGRWYLQGSNDSGENDHIALVPTNKKPTTSGVLSIGNGDVGTDAYFFDYQDSGFINRNFADVSQFDTAYCWDTLRNRESSLASGNAQALSGIIFIKLIDENNIIVQRSTQLSACPANVASLIFDSNGIAFER